MKWLITGGTGFIGTDAAGLLIEAGEGLGERLECSKQRRAA